MSNDAWLDRTDRRYAKAARKIANKAQRAEEFEHRQRISAAQGAVGSLGRFYDSLHAKATKPVDSIDPRLMSDDDLVAAVQAALQADRYDWRGSQARPEQLQPASYRTWLILSGRGWGKTRTCIEAIREWCATPNQHIAVVSKDHKAQREVILDGPSGLLASVPFGDVLSYKTGLGDIQFKFNNGCTVTCYTSENPDAVRGSAFDAVVVDEWASYAPDKAKEIVAQLWFCLRDSADPRMIIATTPRRVPHIIDMIKRGDAGEPGLIVTRGRTRDNTKLSAVALDELDRLYAGTRMGRQELEGELVLDLDLALWSFEMIEGAKWRSEDDLPSMQKVVVGIDPSGSKDGDETGIVVVGHDKHKVLYALQDTSTGGTPAERYTAACLAAYRHRASAWIVETSYGGDNSFFALENQWRYLVDNGQIPSDARMPARIKSLIKGDKAARAMPVVALYEQQIQLPDTRRIWHAPESLENGINRLEDQCLSWETNSTKSPNSIDAYVHAARYLMRELGWEQSISVPQRPQNPAAPARRLGGGYRVY